MSTVFGCPNGDDRPYRGRAHEFVGFVPNGDDATPMMFCSRCGEVRDMVATPIEAVPDREDSAVATMERE